MHDLVIRGGTIVDGSGGEPFEADVAVDGDRIVALGRVEDPGRRTIDADGAVVAPGFIDLHTHCDFTIHDHPAAPAAVHQGVTTLVLGNCGFSGFPVAPGTEARVAGWCGFIGGRRELLARDAGARFGALGALPLVPNVVQLVGHGAIRLAVMGDDPGPPTEAQLDAMDGALGEALAAGSAGLSSGLIYAPGLHAGIDELERLAATAARHDRPVASHVRDEGSGVVGAVEEAISIAERTGAAVHVSHLKSTSRRAGLVEELLAMLERARARGVDVSADQYPYTMSSTKLGAVASMADAEPEKVLIALDPSGRYGGLTLAQLAARQRRDASAALAALPAKVRDGAQVLLLDRMREEDVERILASAAVAVASDGWTLAPGAGANPHPRNFGTFARVLEVYARERGRLSLAAAIRKMTALPAAILRMPHRGRVSPGAVADLVVFDPAAVRENATPAEPHRLASGMREVLVAGDPVLHDGSMTERRPGRVLRRLGEGWSG